MAKYLRLDVAKERDLLEAAQQDLAAKQSSPNPAPGSNQSGRRPVLERTQGPEGVFDERLMIKIDESGFMDGLYR